MKNQILQLVFLAYTMFAGQVAASDINFSTVEQAKESLEKALELCGENIILIDQLLEMAKNANKIDIEKQLEYSIKIEKNTKFIHDALQCEEYNSDLAELKDILQKSIELQTDLMGMFKK